MKLSSPVPTAGSGRVATWAILAVLTMVSFLNYLDRMSLSVLVVQIKRELVLSDTQIGLVSGLGFALFYAIMGVPIARLVDRHDKGIVLAICVGLWTVATALSGAATSFITLLLARAGVGVGEAGCVPASFAIIAQRFSIDRRPFAISIFQSGFLIGSGLGMLGAGWIGEAMGWRATLTIIGLAGLPVALLVAFTLRGSSVAQPAGAPRTALADIRILLSNPAFNHVIAALSVATFGTYSLMQWLPTFLVRNHGVPLSQAGLIMGVSLGIGGMIGILCGGLLAGYLIRRDKRWDLWLCSLVYIVAPILFVAAILSPSLALTASFLFAAITVMFIANGAGLAAVQRFCEPERRATANALLVVCTAIIGVGLGPVFVGVGSDQLRGLLGAESLRWTLAASCLTFLWCSWHFFAASRADGGAED